MSCRKLLSIEHARHSCTTKQNFLNKFHYHTELAARHQLSARHSHSSAVVGNSLWAGKEDKSNDDRSIKHFSILSGEWSTKETTGDPPLADSGYSYLVLL